MNRPQDIRLDEEQLPADQFLVEGSHLTNTMRTAKIPFGVAQTKKDLPGGQRYVATVGLVFFVQDRERVEAALTARAESKKQREKYPSYQRRKEYA